MNQFRNIVLAAALLLGLGQCQKKADPNPADQLPPATQTGANTFGCLVNGQPWTPKGNNGTSNFSADFGSGPRGDYFNILTYRYPDKSSDFQYIILGVNYGFRIGNFSFRDLQQNYTVFNDSKTGCDWDGRKSTTSYSRGTMTITRLDKQAGIFSGTFDFTLFKPGCDSVRVTQGRFDYKF